MTFGLRCSQPACRPHPASLPVRVPAVESLLPASFSFASRLRLAVHYGYRHRLRLAPFIQQDSAHAGHTGADAHTRAGRLRPASPEAGDVPALAATLPSSPATSYSVRSSARFSHSGHGESRNDTTPFRPDNTSSGSSPGTVL